MAAGALSYPVRHPVWQLNYAGLNITANITGMVTEIEYSDSSGAHTHGRGRHSKAEGDSVEVTLEDRNHRWQGPWFPVRGDTVQLSMGYQNEQQLNCGVFQVDDLELKGPPDTFHLKCIATVITPGLRTPRSFAYENTTLDQVAGTVAARNGLSLVNAPQAVSLGWVRITQKQEHDLYFLRRLALAHNYDFTVRGGQLIFYARSRLETAPLVGLVQRMQTKSFEFRTKTQQVYRSATVTYQSPFQKALISGTAGDPTSPTGDDLHIVTRVENPQQAGLKADSALHDANMMEVTGRIETEGNVLLVAGKNIQVQGFGTFDGDYHITASKHRLERSSGYSTEIEMRQL